MEYHEHSYLVSLLFAAPFLLFIIFSKFFSTCVFTFAIYRENSLVNGTYDVVSSVFIAERTSSDVTTDLGSGNFTCVNLTVNDPVPVNAGDVLGACISDPPEGTFSNLILWVDVKME